MRGDHASNLCPFFRFWNQIGYDMLIFIKKLIDYKLSSINKKLRDKY